MLGRRGRRRSFAPVHVNSLVGEVCSREDEEVATCYYGEGVVCNLREEGNFGGSCEENGSPEVKEKRKTDLRGRSGGDWRETVEEHNSSKERKKKKTEERERCARGSDDLLEILKLLGQEVGAVGDVFFLCKSIPEF